MYINSTALIRDHSSSKAGASQGLCFVFKPLLNGLTSSRKKPQVELAWRLTLNGLTDSQGSSQVQASCKKKTFQGFQGCISWANRLLQQRMNVTCVDLGWVGKVKKGASTWSWPKWAQIIARQRKYTQGLANGVASRPKFSTWVHLRVRLARKLNS